MQRSSGASGCNKERKTSRVTKLFQLILRRFKLGKKSRNQKSSNHDDSSDNDEDIEKISTNIFRSKLCKGPNGTYAEEDFAEAFRYFDTNGDGKITHSELQRVLKKLEINITKQEVKKMIHELDKDGNGTIEYTEVFFSAE
jgi:Ca2+-binding EF-hand superfamily protein